MIGGMQPVLSPSQMAAADAAAIAAGSSVSELMARAGYAVSRAVLELGGAAYGLRVVVVCGKGNNAGDGFVAAHRLAMAGAYPVVVMLNDPTELSSAARAAFDAMRGVRKVDLGRGPREMQRASVIVDAIVGTGSRGPLKGAAADAAVAIVAAHRPTVAVDIPSGVDASTGAVTAVAVKADVTVTMGALKPGLLLHPGASHAGSVITSDIGVPIPASGAMLVGDADIPSSVWERLPEAHKRSVGKVLVVGGSGSMPGAVRLAARGALRAGAGLVRLAVPESLLGTRGLDEAVSVGLPETSEVTIEPSAVSRVAELAEDVDVVALGPGLTTHPETVEFVRKCVTAIGKPMVIDADGLNALAGVAGSLNQRSAPTILTPHAMELSRLAGWSLDEVNADRPASARYLSTMTGCVVVSKGGPTLVADADDLFFVTSGGPVLATAGTGDVLTGAIAALACKTGAAIAAWAGAHVHGHAGRMAAGQAGAGILASEVADAIPSVIAHLARGRA